MKKAESKTEDLAKNIGNRIKKIREWRHIAPGELARKINASPSFITRMEQGETVPSVQRLQNIAEELNVSIRDFFSAPTFEGDIFRQNADGNQMFTGKMKDYEYKILISEQSFSPRIDFHPYLMKHKRIPETIYHQHRGWEMIILRVGKLKMLFRKNNVPDIKEEILENPFDILLFNSELWHAYIPEGQEAETICILSDTAITSPEMGRNIGMLQFDNY